MSFASTPNVAVSRWIAELIAPRGRGRRVDVANSGWRPLAAFRAFHDRHQSDPRFADWQREDRPLSELQAVHAILALDQFLAAARPAPAPRVSPTPPVIPNHVDPRS